MRLFFALWPDPALQLRLADWARRAAGAGRPTRRENLHLTLAFLGTAEAALLPVVSGIARALRFSPLVLTLDRVGYWKHNRIIWCGAKSDPQALTQLVADLRAGLAQGGIRFDPKPFVSHLTLVRKSSGLDPARRWAPIEWTVSDFALVRSVPVDGGVDYEVLQRFSDRTRPGSLLPSSG